MSLIVRHFPGDPARARCLIHRQDRSVAPTPAHLGDGGGVVVGQAAAVVVLHRVTTGIDYLTNHSNGSGPVVLRRRDRHRPFEVSQSWWSAYKGAVDAALADGMNVILCAWTESSMGTVVWAGLKTGDKPQRCRVTRHGLNPRPSLQGGEHVKQQEGRTHTPTPDGPRPSLGRGERLRRGGTQPITS